MSEDIFEVDSEVAAEFSQLMHDPAAREAFTQIKMQAANTGARRRYEHVLSAVSETPWAVKPTMLALIVDLIALRIAGERLSADEIDARVGQRRQASEAPQGVAVLALQGVIMPKASMMSDISGGVSIDSFRSQFRQAIAAQDVAGVIIDVDSPGGMVDGVPEMAQEMRAARGAKPIVAVANTEAASAAYWLASQADEFVATKSARVGSIGVYAAHKDESAKSEAEGVKTTIVSAGKFKTEGNPHEPLSEDARAHLQSMVDSYYSMFVSDVSKGRGTSVDSVRNGYGEGRELTATAALHAGMIDRIASVEQVAHEMLGAAKLRSVAAFTGAARTDVSMNTTSNSAITAPAQLNEHGAEVAAMIEDANETLDAEASEKERDSATALSPERADELSLRDRLRILST